MLIFNERCDQSRRVSTAHNRRLLVPIRTWASAFACAVCVALPTTMSAQSTPGPVPTAGQAAAPDHAVFDALLKRHVVKGFVDYDAFAAAPEFPRYLALLERTRLDGLSEDDRLAYWINVYNAYTIQLIIAHRETESIRNINKSLGVLRLKGPWSEPLVRAAGQRLTLDDVFHTILRKEFAEPRVHFAVTCAAIGCVPLRSEAYVGARLVDQLNEQARLFLRESPTRNHIQGNRLTVSPLLMAYRSDFGAARVDLQRFLAPWFEGEERKRLTTGIYFLIESPFDWTLNSQAKGRELGAL